MQENVPGTCDMGWIWVSSVSCRSVGSSPLCQKLRRSMSPARQSPVPGRNRLMEWTISKCPIRMQNKDCNKECVSSNMTTYISVTSSCWEQRLCDAQTLAEDPTHLVSWTGSAAASLRWHLRNGHKIHLILSTACETDIPYRRLAK